MAGHARGVHADFHAAAVATVDAAVRGFGGNDEFRNDLALVVDVLPAHAVAVFFLDGADHHDLEAFRNDAEILHDLGAIRGRGHAAFLVGTAAAVDDLIRFEAFVGVLVPVLDIADANGVDVGVDGDDLVAFSHPADDVAEAVDLDLVVAQLLHLSRDPPDDAFFLAGLGRNGDHVAKETGHVRPVAFRR